MQYYRVPMLIDVFRLTTGNHEQNIKLLVRYLRKSPGGFNYNRAAVFQQKAYQGYADIEALKRQCIGLGNRQDLIENAKVFRLISSLAVGRTARILKSQRKFMSLSRDIVSPMGPTFSFVEGEKLKLSYLHCRNTERATSEDLRYLAAALKYEVLDTLYFELASDLEIIDVYPRDRDGNAPVNVLSLASLQLPTYEDMKAKTDLFVRAFKEVNDNRLAGEREDRRRKSEPDTQQPELPLE